MKKIRTLLVLSVLFLAAAVAFAGFSKAAHVVKAAEIPSGQVLDTNVDTLSLSDLTIGGNTGVMELSHDNRKTTATFAFSAENTNKNLAFKFKFNVVDDTNTDAIQTRVHFDVGDDVSAQDKMNILNIQGNGTFFSRNSAGWGYTQLDALTAGWHDIEYGRIALLENDAPTGTYYVYYKLDGTEVESVVSTFDVSKMDGQMYLYYSSGNTANTIYDINYATTTYEEAKVISLNDLSNGSTPIVNSFLVDKQYNLTYDNSNHKDHYSLVVKFKYESLESNQNQFHFSSTGNKWNSASSIILNNSNGTKVHLGKSTATEAQVGWHDLSFTMTVGTIYNIEFGRLAIMQGETFTGKYNVYLKIDDVLIKADELEIPTSVLEGNLVFLTADGANRIYDASYEPDVYETADEISITDLSQSSSPVGNSITLTANTTYTYTATAEHKSVVFKFQYEVLDQASMDCQIHFTDGWLGDKHGGIVWFRNDKNRISKAGGGYLEANPFAEVGVYTVEVSKLYVVSGGNAGKYYISLSVGGNVALEYVIDEMPDKAAIFMTGKNGDKLYDINYVTNVYETADEVSIMDLSYNNAPVGHTIKLDAQKKYSYTATAAHKSVVYKFQYEVADPSTVSCQFHFANGWSESDNIGFPGGMIWLQNNNSYMRKADKQYIKTGAAFSAAGTYDVEMGKIYVSGGSDAGSYYVYLKVEDNLMLEYFAPGMQDASVLFLTGTNGDYLHDVNYVAPVYETADVITISDLTYLNNDMVGNFVVMDAHKKFAYTATAEHKSVVLKFKYEVLDQKTIDCQFHFSDGWLGDSHGGLVWFRNDKNRISKAGGGYLEANPFAEGETYQVEISKLYIAVGTDAGNYYIALTVDGTLVLEYMIAEMPDKAALFTTGTNGDKLYNYNYVPCTDTHTLVHFDAVAATCSVPGTIEYWWCQNCGKLFSDAEGQTEVTDLTVAAAHTIVHNDAVAPTCTEAGSIEHYECTVCKKLFSDAEGKNEITDIAVAAHHTLVHHDAVAPTCTEDGTIKYYECTVCHKNFSDADAQNEVTDLAVAAHHTLVHHDAVAPTCTDEGSVEYYECTVCHKMFSDAEAANELTTVAVAPKHTLVHREAVAATCTEDGNVEYYHCSECGKNFSDAEGTTQVTNVVDPAHHTLVHHEAVAATCTEDGTVEYWECSVCHNKYADEEGETALADVVAPAHGHTYGTDGKCTACGAQDPNHVESTDTSAAESTASSGCFSSVSGSLVVFLVSLAALVLFRRKREEY